MSKVTMTCMTTKQKFEAEDPPVIMLANGRYAYRVRCPWEGKNGKELYAFKFCSTEAYQAHRAKIEAPDQEEAPDSGDELFTPESPVNSPPESPK